MLCFVTRELIYHPTSTPGRVSSGAQGFALQLCAEQWAEAACQRPSPTHSFRRCTKDNGNTGVFDISLQINPFCLNIFCSLPLPCCPPACSQGQLCTRHRAGQSLQHLVVVSCSVQFGNSSQTISYQAPGPLFSSDWSSLLISSFLFFLHRHAKISSLPPPSPVWQAGLPASPHLLYVFPLRTALLLALMILSMAICIRAFSPYRCHSSGSLGTTGAAF